MAGQPRTQGRHRRSRRRPRKTIRGFPAHFSSPFRFHADARREELCISATVPLLRLGNRVIATIFNTGVCLLTRVGERLECRRDLLVRYPDQPPPGLEFGCATPLTITPVSVKLCPVRFIPKRDCTMALGCYTTTTTYRSCERKLWNPPNSSCEQDLAYWGGWGEPPNRLPWFQTQGTTTDGTKVKDNDKSVGSAAKYRAKAVDEELKHSVRGGEDDVNRLGWCSIQ